MNSLREFLLTLPRYLFTLLRFFVLYVLIPHFFYSPNHIIFTQALALSCRGIASIDIELSQWDTTREKNEIKLAKASSRADAYSAQLAEYNSLLNELKKEQKALVKDKEEFRTLRRETTNVMAAVEKSISENNEYKA